MTDWSTWVLDHGLPELPQEVQIGESVPVARWAGPRFAAVCHLQWMWSDGHEEDYLATETELFRHTASGWEVANGSGGSDWPLDPPLRRPATPPGYAQLGGQTCAGEEGWYCCALVGLAGPEAAVVQVTDDDGDTRREVDSPLGILIAAVDASRPASVTVLDGMGNVLLTKHFEPSPGKP